MSYRDEVMALDRDCGLLFRSEVAEIAARADAEIESWRLRAEQAEVALGAEDARIAELEQSVTVRDTEIARLETDLVFALRDAARYRYARTLNPRQFEELVNVAMATEFQFDELVDAARAGNGGES